MSQTAWFPMKKQATRSPRRKAIAPIRPAEEPETRAKSETAASPLSWWDVLQEQTAARIVEESHPDRAKVEPLGSDQHHASHEQRERLNRIDRIQLERQIAAEEQKARLMRKTEERHRGVIDTWSRYGRAPRYWWEMR